MSWWHRAANVFRVDEVQRDLDEELEAHIDEAILHGRDPDEARRAFGSLLHHREESRDLRIVGWLHSLCTDFVFGWRRLAAQKITSAAAILSLALAIGACTSAFRLIDALLLRPLPIADAAHVYALARRGIDATGAPGTSDAWAYPSFQRMRAAAHNEAELIAVSYSAREDVSYGSDEDVEKASVQYVSGWMFNAFGLHPALGRLLTEQDDDRPGAHAYGVISYEYWSRRFGRDPNVIGHTFRLGTDLYEVVGVAEQPFSGTEPGLLVDIFVPTMMNAKVERSDATWIRILARLAPATSVEALRAKLHATSRAFEAERAKGFVGMTKESIDRFLDLTLILQPAAAGVSGLQQNYGRSLVAIGALVALVLIIACANVANLMMAQAAARAREMALRVAIGAGRARLVRLVLAEGALLGLAASAGGGLFAWWSAPFVVSRISTADNPVRLALPADAHVLLFGVTLALATTLLFSLVPALRASAVRPASALKGGSDLRGRRRIMRGLVAVQAAFCFIVIFAGALFATTFVRLSNRPVGFSAERILVLDTVAPRPQSPLLWEQVAEHLRGVAGVEKVALAGWPLLTPNGWNGFVSVNGAPPGPVLAYFLSTSPGWIDTLRIRLIEGRDLGSGDKSPGSALVNEAFARAFFSGLSPVGQAFAKGANVYRVVGLVADAPYRDLREPMLPVAYVPFLGVDRDAVPTARTSGAFIVRTAAANPLALVPALRQAVAHARPGFRVSTAITQAEINQAQMVRERMLAMLALFFSSVALVLAGVGLYGVLDFSVLQHRREIGIRVALGSPLRDVVKRVTTPVLTMVVAGAAAGLVVGLLSARVVQSLFYEVKPTDPLILAAPAVAMLAVTVLAALPAIVHAARIDAATTLRAE
jgi:putative ABC transport system permease protein